MWIGLQIKRVLLDWRYLPRFLQGETLHSSARAANSSLRTDTCYS
jgi:hypothetical protein